MKQRKPKRKSRVCVWKKDPNRLFGYKTSCKREEACKLDLENSGVCAKCGRKIEVSK